MATEDALPHVDVHVQLSVELDAHHEVALETKLKDCTDDQILAEIARRGLDVQTSVSESLVKDKYKFEKLLGHGASGEVHLVKHKKTGQRFACKVIKQDGGMNDADSMGTEIEIMKRIRHKNVVSLYELFESSKCLWLILELIEGSDLNFFISQCTHYSEHVASVLFCQILQGVHYLHANGVVHRDLKLDNIMLHGSVETGTVKIADFGLSALIKVGSPGYDRTESSKRKDYRGLHEMWGTASYFAPELIQGAYGPQADVWSIGCILYEMLSGSHPFHGRDDEELFAMIKSGFLDVLSPPWDEVSDGAKDLVRKLLTVDPTQRLSCSEALKHPWVTGEGLDETHHAHISTAHGRLVQKQRVVLTEREETVSGRPEGGGRSSPWGNHHGSSTTTHGRKTSIFSFLRHPIFRSSHSSGTD